MVMAYDQHYPARKSGPGRLARRGSRSRYDDLLPRFPPDRLVFVLGSYGYDWTQPTHAAPPVDVLRSAARWIWRAPPMPRRCSKRASRTATSATAMKTARTHDVWFQDALATWNQVDQLRSAASRASACGGSAPKTRRCGRSSARTRRPSRAAVLATLPPVKSTGLLGEGEVFTIRGEPQSGERRCVVGARRRRSRARATRSVPSGSVVERTRRSRTKSVALTFDDGPDERNTGQLLDVLSEAEGAGDVLRGRRSSHARARIWSSARSREGHLVGNHSFTHPHLDKLTPREARCRAHRHAAPDRRPDAASARRCFARRTPPTSIPSRADDLGRCASRCRTATSSWARNVDPTDWQADQRRARSRSRMIDQVTSRRRPHRGLARRRRRSCATPSRRSRIRARAAAGAAISSCRSTSYWA